MAMFDKIKDFADKNPDKVNQGIEKAGDLFDQKTDRKYEGQVDKAQEIAREKLTGK